MELGHDKTFHWNSPQAPSHARPRTWIPWNHYGHFSSINRERAAPPHLQGCQESSKHEALVHPSIQQTVISCLCAEHCPGHDAAASAKQLEMQTLWSSYSEMWAMYKISKLYNIPAVIMLCRKLTQEKVEMKHQGQHGDVSGREVSREAKWTHGKMQPHLPAQRLLQDSLLAVHTLDSCSWAETL